MRAVVKELLLLLAELLFAFGLLGVEHADFAREHGALHLEILQLLLVLAYLLIQRVKLLLLLEKLVRVFGVLDLQLIDPTLLSLPVLLVAKRLLNELVLRPSIILGLLKLPV